MKTMPTPTIVHASPADLRMRRLLRLPLDAPKASEASARSLVERSLLISMVRCLLTYVVLPFVAPILGIGLGVTPAVGILVGLVAIVANVRVHPSVLAGRPPVPLALHGAGVGDHRAARLAHHRRPGQPPDLRLRARTRTRSAPGGTPLVVLGGRVRRLRQRAVRRP